MSVAKRIEFVRKRHGACVARAVLRMIPHRDRSGAPEIWSGLFAPEPDCADWLPDWIEALPTHLPEERYIPWLGDQVAKLAGIKRIGVTSRIDYEAYRQLFETLYRKWPELRDWMIQTRPNVSSLPWEAAVARADEWHRQMREKAEAEARRIDKDDVGDVLKEWPDGWTLQDLYANQLDAEGAAMGHCVGGSNYRDRVAQGDLQIMSLRDEHNQPWVTFEVEDAVIEQAKGRGNLPPSKVHRPRVLEAARIIVKDQIDLPEDFADWSDEHIEVLGEAAVAVPKPALEEFALRNQGMLHSVASVMPHDHPLSLLLYLVKNLGSNRLLVGNRTPLQMPGLSPAGSFLAYLHRRWVEDGHVVVEVAFDVDQAMSSSSRTLADFLIDLKEHTRGKPGRFPDMVWGYRAGDGSPIVFEGLSESDFTLAKRRQQERPGAPLSLPSQADQNRRIADKVAAAMLGDRAHDGLPAIPELEKLVEVSGLELRVSPRPTASLDPGNVPKRDRTSWWPSDWVWLVGKVVVPLRRPVTKSSGAAMVQEVRDGVTELARQMDEAWGQTLYEIVRERRPGR